MAIDLITGHQGVAHISAEQIANINNALMDDYGVDKVVRLDDGTLTQDGLTINVGTGFWRVNGFDMEIQEAETVYIDPTATGLSRIDNIYVEILQDIPTGSQRSEIVTVQGEAAASPVAPDAPTAPVLNTDILLQVTPLATVTVTEGAMVMTDLTIAYEMVTPSELEAVETIATGAQEAVTDIVNVYGAKNLIPYSYLTTPIVDAGITITPLGDGTYKLNGTATSFVDVRLSPWGISSYDTCLTLEKGVYILSGTPISSVSGGSGKANVGLVKNDGTNRSNVAFDLGDGYTLIHSNTAIRYEVKISVPSGVTVSNLIFKPMLRLASIQDDTYVPYAKTNKELTDAFTNQISNSDDAYSPSKAYKVGEHCIYNNVLYKCITPCSAAAWSVNQNCFEETTLTSAVTDLNNDLSDEYTVLTVKTGTQSEGADVCTEDTSEYDAFDVTIQQLSGMATTFRVMQGGDAIGCIKHPTVFNYWYGRRLYCSNGILKHGKAFDQSASVLNNNQDDAKVIKVIGCKFP